MRNANSGLTTVNSELTAQVEQLREEHARLQDTIERLQSRSFEEALAEAKAKLNVSKEHYPCFGNRPSIPALSCLKQSPNCAASHLAASDNRSDSQHNSRVLAS